MKEFWHKHKVAILISGGLLLLLYLFYEYEQNAAANAVNTAATTTDPLSVGGTPLVYGSGTTGTSIASGDNTPTTTGSVLGNYTGSTTGQQIPNTSSSGLPTSSPGNAPTNAASPTVPIPSGSSTTVATAQPFTATPVTQAQANQITSIAKAAVANSSCNYALNGVNTDTGVPLCGPNGYQFSGTGGLSTIDPDVNGLYPGQPGYAQAVQNNLNVIEGDSPGDTQDIANYQALLQAYGGITVSDTEGSQAGAGSTSTQATSGTSGSTTIVSSRGNGMGTASTTNKPGTQVTPAPRTGVLNNLPSSLGSGTLPNSTGNLTGITPTQNTVTKTPALKTPLSPTTSPGSVKPVPVRLPVGVVS